MHQSFITTILVFLLELRFALTAPIAVSNEQQQVLLEEHEQAHPKVQDTKATVGIAFQSTSLSSNDYAEIPIGKRISFHELPNLPRRPTKGRIIHTYTSTHHAIAEPNETTLCMLFPRVRDPAEDVWLWGRSKDYAAKSPSGKALLERGRARAPAPPVWWTFKDGWVSFEGSNERAALKGGEIEAILCI